MSIWHYLVAFAPTARHRPGGPLDDEPDEALVAARLGIAVTSTPPYDVPPADTEYEYAFRYAAFTGDVDPVAPIAETRERLLAGEILQTDADSSTVDGED